MAEPGTIQEHYDAIIVGGRVAGASLATHIVQQGYSALVVERAAFPRDTLSTHIFQNLDTLERLGVLDRLLATGAPLLTEFRLRMDGLDLSQDHDDLPMLAVRRRVLDPILLDRAARAGADVLSPARVTGLLSNGARVTGVRLRDPGRREREIHARVVVGADGRTSTVARLVGARRYNVTRSERSGGFAYFEGVEPGPVFHFYVEGTDYFLGYSTDSGLFLASMMWGSPDFRRYHDADGTAFDAALATCRPLAKALAGGRRIRPPVFIGGWEGYFREAAGPGWVLVGDAGHFKDPAPGQGISDALRQAEGLAAAICRGIETHTLPAQLKAWWRWRDWDAAEMYWWAREFGRGGRQSPVIAEMLRAMAGSPRALRATHEIVFHRRRPFRVFTPPRVAAAATRLLVAGSLPRGQVLAETRTLVRRDLERRYRTRRPKYEE
ncbi:MAG TPA: NAD(P)/FAD-dependent oxidoreductase [Actinomycetota bacterium]|nr:NAD(P)/FAD-dependent oxidoreductase [Actinomycetota bacterium]